MKQSLRRFAQCLCLMGLCLVERGDAQASTLGPDCCYVFRGAGVQEPAVQEIFKAFPDVKVLEVCEGGDYPAAYYLLSEIVVDEGVAGYIAERVFRHETGGHVSWNNRTPDAIPSYQASVIHIWSLSDGQNMDYGDKRFVIANNVTRGEYRRVVSAWEDGRCNPRARRAIFGGMSLLYRWGKGPRSLRKALEDDRLLSVSYMNRVGNGERGGHRYHMDVQGEAGTWFIEWEDRKADVVIINVAGPSDR